jgi:CRISPR-associated protein Cmr3
VKKEGDGIYLTLNGFRARLMSSAVNRYEVISGWDMAKKCPKDAVRVIPGGSVYWFEVEQGDTSALEDIWKAGLIPADDEKFANRRREGFGSVWFGMA